MSDVIEQGAGRRELPRPWLLGGLAVALVTGLVAAVVWWPEGEPDLFYSVEGPSVVFDPVGGEPEQKWEWRAPDRVVDLVAVGDGQAAALLDGGSAASPDDAGELVLLGSDGQERWRAEGGTTVRSYSAETVTTFSEDFGEGAEAQIRTYGLADGAQIWSRPGRVVGADGGRLFVADPVTDASTEPTTAAVDLLSGGADWEADGHFAGVVGDRVVLVDPPTVRVHDRDTGELVWSTPQNAGTQVAAAEGFVLLVAGEQATAYALDDGAKLWSDNEIPIDGARFMRVALDRVAVAPRPESEATELVVVDRDGRAGSLQVGDSGVGVGGMLIDEEPYLLVASATVELYDSDLDEPVGSGDLLLPAEDGYYLLEGDQFALYRAGAGEPRWAVPVDDLFDSDGEDAFAVSAADSALIAYRDDTVRWFE